jgi:DNA-binding transcriptional LysR family regulator
MELRQLRYYKQAYETGSFSGAAKALSITQQGLSLSIDKLEKELGVILFLRRKNGVEPTEISASFKKDVDHLLSCADELKTKIQAVARQVNGTVRIGLTPAAVPYFVPRLLSEFNMLYPHVKLQITEMNDLVCEAAISGDTLDLACVMEPRGAKSMEWSSLFEDQVMVIMHRDNPLSSRDMLSFADLAGEDFIVPQEDFRWYQIIIDQCKDAGFQPKISYITSDLSLINSIVRECNCIAFMSKNFLAVFNPLNHEEITHVPLQPGALPFKLGLLRKKEKKVNYLCEILFSYMRDISANNLSLT